MQYGKSVFVAVGIALVALAPACASILGLHDVTAPTCSDGQRDGDETDVDCGGSCGACTAGRVCSVAADCMSSVCEASQCAAPSCSDRVKNGDESDVDCGGPACGGCGVGQICGKFSDCAGSEVCDAALCRAALSCLDILQGRPGVASGVYSIAPVAGQPFDAYCDMDTTHDGGGWTLLLQANGDSTLAYDAAYWTNTDLLDAADLTVDSGKAHNAKYQSFVALPVKTLVGELDGFRYSFAVDGRTAQQLFLGANQQGEPILADADKVPALGSGPSWLAQPNCRKFGINTPDLFARTRFGWTANQETTCGTNDTAIGLGLITQRAEVPTPHGAGYVCLAGGCLDGTTPTDRTIDAGGNGFLWGR